MKVTATRCAASASLMLVIAASGCGLIYDVCTSELGFAVEPTAATIHAGDEFDLRARAWSCGGRERVPIDIVWSASDSTVLRVTPGGSVTGLTVGSAEAIGIDRGRYGVGPFHVPVQVRP